MTNIFNKIIEDFVQKPLLQNKYLSYEYDKYLYNINIDIKEQSIHFINKIINNNKTTNDIKIIAIKELKERPSRLLEQEKYLNNIKNKNIIITDIIQNISNNDPEWLLEIIDDLKNFSYSIQKPNSYSSFLHKLKWELAKNFIKQSKLIDKFFLLKDISDNELLNFIYYQIKINIITNDDIRKIYKSEYIEQISNIINNVKIKDNNWGHIHNIWQNFITLAIQNNKYNKIIYKIIFVKLENKNIVINSIINKIHSFKFYDILFFRLDWIEYQLIIDAIDNFIINKINNEPYWPICKIRNINKHLKQKWLFVLKTFNDLHQIPILPKVIKSKNGKLRFRRKNISYG